jgi:NAD(P)-dependent dehydrogenase (short-subunit alcohol dehydrogenase family)
MSFDLNNKRVLVTGASRGIGLEVARAFVEANASVAILAEREEIFGAAKELELGKTARVQALHCDITDRARLCASVRSLERIDVLVANAGTGDITHIDDPSPEVDEIFERIIRVNLIGAFNTVRAALPVMPDGGRIIFTTSVHGQAIAPPAMSAYAASKAGVEAMVKSFARELGPRGINVNAIAPGMVTTELTLNAIRKLFGAQISREADAMSEADMIRQLNASQAIHFTPIDPARMAQFYLLLASDAGSEITGQSSINVDHGMAMK